MENEYQFIKLKDWSHTKKRKEAGGILQKLSQVETMQMISYFWHVHLLKLNIYYISRRSQLEVLISIWIQINWVLYF